MEFCHACRAQNNTRGDYDNIPQAVGFVENIFAISEKYFIKSKATVGL
jgi:hypothetical protein